MRKNQYFPALEAKRLYERGHSLREIAAQIQCAYETVRKWLIHAGVTRRGRGGLQGTIEEARARMLKARHARRQKWERHVQV